MQADTYLSATYVYVCVYLVYVCKQLKLKMKKVSSFWCHVLFFFNILSASFCLHGHISFEVKE